MSSMASIPKQTWDPYYIYLDIYIYSDVTIYVYTSMHAFGVYSFIYKFVIYYLFCTKKKFINSRICHCYKERNKNFNIIS